MLFRTTQCAPCRDQDQKEQPSNLLARETGTCEYRMGHCGFELLETEAV